MSWAAPNLAGRKEVQGAIQNERLFQVEGIRNKEIIFPGKKGRLAKCPPAEEWIKKLWSMHTIEYYSATRKNGIMPFATTWMDLEVVLLREVSQTEEEKYHMTSLLCGI